MTSVATTTSVASTTSVAASTTPVITGTTSAAPSGKSWNITLDGRPIAQGEGVYTATCAHQTAISRDPSNPSGESIHIVAGPGTTDLIAGSLEVQKVSITDDSGDSYLYDPKQVSFHVGGGDAQAAQSGMTYTIIGHIAPYQTVQGQTLKDATPVPFEFEVTCSER